MKFFNFSLSVLLGVLLVACSANAAVDSVSPQASKRFSARIFHQVVTWNGKLWLVGGYTKDGDKSDVWWSNDGAQWTLATANAGFSPRTGHQLVVYNNQLWVIGGAVGKEYKNDVWSSRDGTHWVLQTANAAFAPRTSYQAVAYKNKLWVIGGRLGDIKYSNGQLTGLSNDVWSSLDGINWTQQTASAEFLPRMGHQVAVFNNKLWLVGGFNLSDYGDVWSSRDGSHWLQETAKAAFGFRNFSSLAVYNNQLWVIAGHTIDSAGNRYANDIWSSPDGIAWARKKEHAEFSARWGLQVVSFNKQLLVIGGDKGVEEKQTPYQMQNDIWSSRTGALWQVVN